MRKPGGNRRSVSLASHTQYQPHATESKGRKQTKGISSVSPPKPEIAEECNSRSYLSSHPTKSPVAGHWVESYSFSVSSLNWAIVLSRESTTRSFPLVQLA